MLKVYSCIFSTKNFNWRCGRVVRSISSLTLILIALLSQVSAVAQISGFVFRDFNGNGTRQATQGAYPPSTYTPGFVEPLVAGVIVTAYDENDQILASYTTTGSNLSSPIDFSPNYIIPASGAAYNGVKGSNTGSVPNNVSVRLEFAIPKGVNNQVDGSFDFSSMGGNNYGTSVQLLQATGVARGGVSFALNNPKDYVAGNSPANTTYVFQGVQFSGDPLAGGAGSGSAATARALVKFPYSRNGTTALTASEVLATGAQIGSVYGVAYSRHSKRVFASAFMKRHVGFGPSSGNFSHSPGAIYIVDPAKNSSNGAAGFFVSLDQLGYPTHNSTGTPAYGSSTSYALSQPQGSGATRSESISFRENGLGVVGTNAARGLGANKSAASHDPAAFGQVGKVSLGAIEMSEDGQFLFVVNLYDRKIYQLQFNSITNPTSASVAASWELPAPPARSLSGYPGAHVTYASATNGFSDGTVGVQRPFALKFRNGKLYIGAVTTGENGGRSDTDNNAGNVEYTDLWAYVWELTPSSGFNSEPILQLPLNYFRGVNGDGYDETWKPWTNNFPQSNVWVAGGSWSLSQPMLTGIEFDVEGSMILGFRDLSGDKGGYQNHMLSGNTARSAVGFGDQLRAFWNGLTGRWEIESGGKEGPSSTKPASAGHSSLPGMTGQRIHGRGGSEFYYTNGLEKYNGVNGTIGTHLNTAMGGLALLPGMAEVMGTFMDPLALWSGGVSWSSNYSGLNTRDYQLYVGQAVGDIGKANGLGDIEILFENPPIEIGNRVWRDLNQNGIQDPGEPGIGGVVLELVDESGNPVDSDPDLEGVQPTFVTTDDNGNWFISSASGTDGLGINYGVALLPQTSYRIRLATTGTGSDWDSRGYARAGGDLEGLSLTRSNISGNGEEDLSDSDAALVSGVPEVAFVTAQYGQNDHTLDIGFVFGVNLGNQVWHDANNNGIFDVGEAPLSGVIVNLYRDADNDGEPDDFVPIATTTTDSDGLYLFNSLMEGSYIVGVINPQGMLSSTVDELDPDSDVDSNDNGITTILNSQDLYETFSGTVTLSVGGEPTGEVPNNNPADGSISDESSNLTVDFGFYEPMTLGNKVWNDPNKNGIIDADEEPFEGATVHLYSVNEEGEPYGAPLQTRVTDEYGLYLFENLSPGRYIVSVINPDGYISSPGGSVDPDDDVDGDDNGVRTVENADLKLETFSNPVTLVNRTEPTEEMPDNNVQGVSDNNSNLTVDFGFFDSALPVKLKSFNAKSDEEGQVIIDWSTSQELNSSYFEVERSLNGGVWASVGIIASHGESEVTNTYRLIDTKPSNGNNFYRLKMVDKDGTFAYSNIVSAKVRRSVSLNLYPNPASTSLKIETESGVQVKRVQVYSAIGKLVKEVKGTIGNGLDISSLVAGSYLVIITTEDGAMEERRVVVVR